MILDLFDLSRTRPGSGGIPIERQMVDALPIVHKVIAEYEAASPDRPIKLLHEGELSGHWDGGPGGADRREPFATRSAMATPRCRSPSASRAM